MEIRIRHQNLVIDGAPRAEGEILETSDPTAIAYALGYKLIRKGRMTARGERIENDKIAAEPVMGSAPTPEEDAAAKEVASFVPVSRPFWRPRQQPAASVSLDKVAAEAMGQAIGEAVGMAMSKAQKPAPSIK